MKRYFLITIQIIMLFSFVSLSVAQTPIISPTKRIDKQLINQVVFSPDSKLFAVAGDEGIWIYNINSLKGDLFKGHDNAVACVAFSPDGKSIVSGGWDKTVRLWNVKTGKNDIIGDHKDVVFCIDFSPDGKTVASSSLDTIKLWNVKEQNQIGLLEPNAGHIWSLTFSPDGKTLAVGTSQSLVQFWDVENKKKISEIQSDFLYVYAVSFTSDSSLFAWTGFCNVHVMNVKTSEIADILLPDSSDSISISPNGELIAITSGFVIKIWSLKENRELVEVSGYNRLGWGFDYVTFSPDGKWIVYNGDRKTALFWQVDLSQGFAANPKDRMTNTWGRIKDF